MNLPEFITSQEGKEHKAYKDADGYSIGVGHFLTKQELISGIIEFPNGVQVYWKDGLTDDGIDALLQKDIEKVGRELEQIVTAKLAVPQWQALIDFVFNEGIGHFAGSTLLKKINLGAVDIADIQPELDKWVMSSGLVNQGLVKRRKLEGDIWCGKLILE